MRTLFAALIVLGPTGLLLSQAMPPQDFPEFKVPGHEREMGALRRLYWQHYPGAGPKATLWDEWLSDAALWPATTTEGLAERMRQQWCAALQSRILDNEGYVATHQHASIAHQLGWPFPFWNQGRGFGWHFSFQNTVGEGWRPKNLSGTSGWVYDGATDQGIQEPGWRLAITNAFTSITAPEWKCSCFEAPFLQVRWQPSDRIQGPFIEWTTPAETNFTAVRRMYFDPPDAGRMVYSIVPLYRHPLWTGEVSRVRLGFESGGHGSLALQALFSQYDTRHNINGQNFVRGCAKYFWWTKDVDFLRANIQRMRSAVRYIMTEHQALEQKVVVTDWVGHDGRSGLKRKPDGAKETIPGQGIGNNYWDLLPFGGRDCYATIQYYDALLTMVRLEREIAAHPDWQIPRNAVALAPDFLERHANEVKTAGNRLFWSRETGRFVACIDGAGDTHDYGFTFLNAEAIYYDFASPAHAKEIMSWLNGDRVVRGDTSTAADIYHWRFAARSTTRRNIDWYFWAWSAPESIPWGGQVQDGGAVLGFGYHDLMARIKVLGPDNAWKRLQEVLKWYEEVETAGGYRKYYNGKRDGTLQGGGTAGGLGLDHEFFESVLVPQVVLRGFLGFSPAADGFSLDLRLPAEWPEITVSQIRLHDWVLDVKASKDAVEIQPRVRGREDLMVRPGPQWEGAARDGSPTLRHDSSAALHLKRKHV